MKVNPIGRQPGWSKQIRSGGTVLLSGYAGMLACEAKIPAGNHSKLKSAGMWIVRLYADSDRKRVQRNGGKSSVSPDPPMARNRCG